MHRAATIYFEGRAAPRALFDLLVDEIGQMVLHFLTLVWLLIVDNCLLPTRCTGGLLTGVTCTNSYTKGFVVSLVFE